MMLVLREKDGQFLDAKELRLILEIGLEKVALLTRFPPLCVF